LRGLSRSSSRSEIRDDELAKFLLEELLGSKTRTGHLAIIYDRLKGGAHHAGAIPLRIESATQAAMLGTNVWTPFVVGERGGARRAFRVE
jgi:hypothetical protein